MQRYHNLLEIEFRAIFEICLLQKEVSMSWSNIKKFINKDIVDYSKKIDSNIEDCCILNIRKWMELWVDIDEYKILNIMRWFGGYEEKHLQKIYDNVLAHLECTCPHKHSSSQTQSLLKTKSNLSKKLTKVKSVPALRESKHYVNLFLKYVDTIVKS